MALKSKNKVSANFNMSSMTDIVFLLLIFFMLTSTLITQNALDLLLAKSSNSNTKNPLTSVQIKYVEGDKPTFHIDSDENNPIEIEDLANILLDRLKTKEESDRGIKLEADKRVDWEYIVTVMDIAYKNNLKIVASTDPLE